jgi:hypothetical protein
MIAMTLQMRLVSNPHTWLRKALTVSSVGDAAVKYFGFAGGSGSTGAAGTGGRGGAASGIGTDGTVWGAGAGGTAGAAWAKTAEVERVSRRVAVRDANRFFNEFLLCAVALMRFLPSVDEPNCWVLQSNRINRCVGGKVQGQ